MNKCKPRKKKSGKLIMHDIFLSPRAIISEKKINGSKPNCILA
jgi:hypothetical protein